MEQPKKSQHELIWKESQDAYSRHRPLHIENEKIGASFAQLAIRSALFLNGGAR